MIYAERNYCFFRPTFFVIAAIFVHIDSFFSKSLLSEVFSGESLVF